MSAPTVYTGTLQAFMLIHGPLRVGISLWTSSRSAVVNWPERGSIGSSAGSCRFQKLVRANSCMPDGNGVATSSGPSADGAGVAGTAGTAPVACGTAGAPGASGAAGAAGVAGA